MPLIPLPAVIAVYAVIVLASFLPGYFFLHNLPSPTRQRLLNDDSFMPIAFGFSVILIASIQFLTYILHGPSAFMNLMLYGLIVSALFVRAWRLRVEFSLPRTWICFVLFLFYLLSLLALIPNYGTGFTADYGFYFPNSSVYLRKVTPVSIISWGGGIPLEYLVKRTPLLCLFGTFFLSLFGQFYAYFQLTCTVVNSLIFWAIYLLAKECFGKRAAAAALMLAALSPALIRESIVAEPKFAATFFLLMAMYFYIKIRDGNPKDLFVAHSLFASACGVASFMTHPSMLFFVFWIYADQVYSRLMHRRAFNLYLWGSTAMAGLVFAVPWYVWNIHEVGWHHVFSPVQSMSHSRGFYLPAYLQSQAEMLIASVLMPLPLSDAILNARLPADWGNWMMRFYDQTFLGGLTLSVGLVVLFAGWNAQFQEASRKFRRLLYGWMCLGCLFSFSILLQGDWAGNATNVMAPLFILWLCYAGEVLSRLRPLPLSIVLATASVELIGTRISILYLTRGQEKFGMVYLYDFIHQWIHGAGLAALFFAAATLAVVYTASVRRRFS